MKALALLTLALTLVWVVASMTLPEGAPGLIYPALLALHVLLGVGLMLLGRPDLDARGLRVRLVNVVLLLIPPLAPMVFCLVASGVALRAGSRWNPDHPARQDLFRLGHSWRKLGAAGVAMGVIWGWGFGSTVVDPGPGTIHPWVDPLTSFRVIIGTGLRVLLIGLSLLYGRTLLMTIGALRQHRQAVESA